MTDVHNVKDVLKPEFLMMSVSAVSPNSARRRRLREFDDDAGPVRGDTLSAALLQLPALHAPCSSAWSLPEATTERQLVPPPSGVVVLGLHFSAALATACAIGAELRLQLNVSWAGGSR